MQEEYYIALLKCVKRYREMSPEDLISFIDLFEEKIYERYPLMKLNRWLGYIQGVLITKGITTIDEERDWTRPLFRPLDF
jgi:hypothetical protein